MENSLNRHFVIDRNARSRAERAQAIDEAYVDAFSEALCFQLGDASPSLIHAKAIELKVTRKLTPALMLAMVCRGAAVFTESALALASGRTMLEIRDTLRAGNRESLESVLLAARIDGASMPAFLRAARECYGNSAP